MHSVIQYKSQIVFIRLNTWSSSTLKMLVSPIDFDGHQNIKSCERNIRSISIAKKFKKETSNMLIIAKILLNFTIFGLIQKKDYKC